jgi:phosphoserine phosphatase
MKNRASFSGRFILFLIAVFLFGNNLSAQSYKNIAGWSPEINNRIKSFLESTKKITDRKVAVFDGDGTVFGQVPHYLADEALYRYADLYYKGKTDSVSLSKMKILEEMVKDGNNVGKPYVENRVHFLEGMTTEEVAEVGYQCYLESYQGKFYPEMKALIQNLKSYGFEVWILTASPEYLYQKFISVELGLPVINIVGAKSVIVDDRLTNEIVKPIPQDDGKANSIPTFIKARPLIVGGNSRGDMDMINLSTGLKIVVNPDDITVRGADDGPMSGYTVKSYWEKEGALIVKCNDVRNPKVRFHTGEWKIRENIPHEKK